MQSIEGITVTKMLVVQLVRKNSYCLTAFELGHWHFSCIRTQTQTLALPGFQSSRPSNQNDTIGFHDSKAFLLRLDLNQWLSYACSLPTHLADVGT